MDALSTTEHIMNKYFYPILLVFGVFGHFMNIVVFSGRNLRIYSCFTYFVWASVSAIFGLLIGIIPMIDNEFSSSSSWTKNSAFCKFEFFFNQIFGFFGRWALVFACADRCFESSEKEIFRKFSTIRSARIFCLATFFVLTIFSLHNVFEVEASSSDGTKSFCSFRSRTGSTYNDFYVAIVGSFLPAIFVIIFRFVFLQNIENQNDSKRKNVALMIAGKVLFFLILNFTDFAFNYYTAISHLSTQNPAKINEIERFFQIFAQLFSFCFVAALFYFNTTAAKIFRSELIRILHDLFSCPNRQRVEPEQNPPTNQILTIEAPRQDQP